MQDRKDETGRVVSRGVYVCRLGAGDFATSKKLIALRWSQTMGKDRHLVEKE